MDCRPSVAKEEIAAARSKAYEEALGVGATEDFANRLAENAASVRALELAYQARCKDLKNLEVVCLNEVAAASLGWMDDMWEDDEEDGDDPIQTHAKHLP